LDAFKDFKTIPDLDKKSAITLLKNKIDKLPESDRLRLLKYALKYPPRARAFLGALLTALKKDNEINSLKASLNPLTSYKLGIKEEIMPTARSWNIN